MVLRLTFCEFFGTVKIWNDFSMVLFCDGFGTVFLDGFGTAFFGKDFVRHFLE